MALTPFDHIKAIYSNQRIDYYDELSEVDKKTFTPYMINKIISMNPDFISVVNEVQQYWNAIGPRELYLFYSQIIPKGNYFNKYIKASKEQEYEFWLICLVAEHFGISRKEAVDALQIYYASDEGKTALRTICENHAVEQKLIKKVKL